MKTTINTTDINNSNELSHVSKLTGRTYQIGSLVCPITGKHFDVTVVTDFHNDIEDSNFEIVTFYFGDYDYDTTEAYIKLAGGVPQKKPSLERYCQDALNILCDTQALDSSMPIEWSNYCETAQCIDPNGDWTDVAYTPDNLQALIDFYTNARDELIGTIEEREASLNTPCDNTGICPTTYPKYYTECHKSEVQIVEISNAQFHLIQEAMRYAAEQIASSNGDVQVYSGTEEPSEQLFYGEELTRLADMFDKAETTDSIDIQVRY